MKIELNEKTKNYLNNCTDYINRFHFNGDINAHNLYYAVKNLQAAIESLDGIEIKELEK